MFAQWCCSGIFGLMVLLSGAESPQSSPPQSPTTPASWWSSNDQSGSTLQLRSDAEKIVLLQRALEADRKQVEQLKTRLNDPASEYQLAETDFQVADTQLTELKKRLRKMEGSGNKAEVEKLGQELQPMQQDWQAAKARFELAIAEHRTLQDKLTALTRKIEQEQTALQKLRDTKEQTAAWYFGKEPAATGVTQVPATAPTTTNRTGTPSAMAIAQAAVTSTAPAGETPGEAKPPKKDVLLAREEARAKETQARAAKERSKSIEDRIKDLRYNLELEQRLNAINKQKADTALAEQTRFESEHTQRVQAGAPAAEVKALGDKLAAAKIRHEQAREAYLSSLERTKELQSEMDVYQSELLAVKQEAERKDSESLKAQQRLAEVENPYTWRNIQQWLLDHGPRLLLILLGLWLLNRSVRLTGTHIVRFISRNHKRGSHAEKEARAKTLEGVLHNTTGLFIIIGGTLMVLFEVGLPVMPLLGGAGIFGLAVAFGAQNLIKDYFCGFMVLLEDQYGINDYVQIGSIEGTVEQISLRVTALRDQKGALHFIPHGTINAVSNFTHTWSRAKVLLAVSYREDIDRVLQVLHDVVREVRQDPLYRELILEDPESMGIADLTDTAVTIQFYLRTRPMQQWGVRREVLRRIKVRFEQANIAIPLQTRTLHPPQEAQDVGQRRFAA